MKKAYTRKQITEAIAYWEKQLANGNYRKVNENLKNDETTVLVQKSNDESLGVGDIYNCVPDDYVKFDNNNRPLNPECFVQFGNQILKIDGIQRIPHPNDDEGLLLSLIAKPVTVGYAGQNYYEIWQEAFEAFDDYYDMAVVADINGSFYCIYRLEQRGKDFYFITNSTAQL